MSPEKHMRLRAIGNDPALQWSAGLTRIVSETNRQLDRLARCVGECKAVDEAANFCRWLQFSGVLSLPHPDFAILRKKSDEVLHRVGEIYKGGRVKPAYEASDIEAINSKLDFLLATIPQAKQQTGDVVDVEEPSHATCYALPPAHFKDL